jgi:phosphotransferase system  glucose/maltose/N-acetylglucosamine-specific IIC component
MVSGLLDSIKYHGVFPSVKGSILFLTSWVLNIWNDNNRSIVLWVLTVIVTIYAIYDFHLKIRYKHRKEREEKEERERVKNEEQNNRHRKIRNDNGKE